MNDPWDIHVIPETFHPGDVSTKGRNVQRQIFGDTSIGDRLTLYPAYCNVRFCPSGNMMTYITSPGYLVRARIGANVALEVDVVSLFDVGSVEGGAQAHQRLGHV
jgi:hypothetical protein